jgi:hypothetical protein
MKESETTAIVLVDNNHPSTHTDAENLARRIIARMESVSAKLRSLEDDIRKLWTEFDKLKPGETILGCATKKEFCERKLNRTPRTVQYLLAGQSNPADRPRSELSSPAVPASAPSSTPISNRKQRHADIIKQRPELAGASPKELDAAAHQQRQAELNSPSFTETKWISKENQCPTGKRSFEYPDDIWQAMRAEGTIEETDFIAYIGKCGQCGHCHRDKDQSGHKEFDEHPRHQTWYRPDEINIKRCDLQSPAEDPYPPLAFGTCTITPKNIGDTRCLSMAQDRLRYCQEKIQLLMELVQDPEATEFKNTALNALQIYLKTFQKFETFAADGVKLVTEFLAMHEKPVEILRRAKLEKRKGKS